MRIIDALPAFAPPDKGALGQATSLRWTRFWGAGSAMDRFTRSTQPSRTMPARLRALRWPPPWACARERTARNRRCSGCGSGAGASLRAFCRPMAGPNWAVHPRRSRAGHGSAFCIRRRSPSPASPSRTAQAPSRCPHRPEIAGFPLRPEKGCMAVNSSRRNLGSSHRQRTKYSQISVPSAHVKASSTSKPRHLTMLLIFVCPGKTTPPPASTATGSSDTLLFRRFATRYDTAAVNVDPA